MDAWVVYYSEGGVPTDREAWICGTKSEVVEAVKAMAEHLDKDYNDLTISVAEIVFPYTVVITRHIQPKRLLEVEVDWSAGIVQIDRDEVPDEVLHPEFYRNGLLVDPEEED